MKNVLRGALAIGCVFVSAIAGAQVFSFSHTWDPSDPQMANRLTRNGVPSVYGTPKAFPGTLGGPVFFFTFTISNPNTTVSALTTTTTNLNPTIFHSFTAAYFGSFNPTNLAGNYAGDEGSSPGTATTSMSIEVPALTDVVIMVGSLNTTTNAGLGFRVDGALTPVPEPASMLAVTAGIGALIARRRRRNR